MKESTTLNVIAGLVVLAAGLAIGWFVIGPVLGSFL